MTMLTGLLNDPDIGGIGGLVSAFQKNGLGDVVASWISNNTNLPISAEQIQSLLGQGPLQDVASCPMATGWRRAWACSKAS